MTAKFLKGRRVVVTGAGRGLGRAIAIVAGDCGARLVLLGRDLSALESVAGTIHGRTGSKPEIYQCDLGKPASIASACDAVLDGDENIDVLVNNGAPWLEGQFEDFSDVEIASTVSAAVTGTMLVTRRLLPALRRSACADIVTIVSTSGIAGLGLDGGSVPFYAAKHGQSGFADKLRQELKGSGIRVSAIYPPDFDDADPAAPAWSDGAVENSGISGRDVVATVMFVLASPRTCNYPVVILEDMKSTQDRVTASTELG